jgi:CheY-like chemotaxis protein
MTATPQPGEAGAGRPRVLVVDDEPEMGKMLARVLQPSEVVFAQSATGALGRIAAGGRFDAIVCDVRMPGLDGIQFHDEVQKLAPGLERRIVYVTATVGTRSFTEFQRRTGCAYLEKPFDPVELRRVLAALTAPRSEP